MHTPATIEETYEHRMVRILRGVLKNSGRKITTADEMFTLLETSLADEFANAVIADMTMWDEEQNWFDKATEK